MKNVKALRIWGLTLLAALLTSVFSLKAQNTYVKISSADELTEGTYLIVCETKSTAAAGLDGKMLAVATNVTAAEGKIMTSVATSETGAEPHEFLLTKSSEKWTIKDIVANKFVKTTAAKALTHDASAWEWTISISNGDAKITSSATSHGYLQYNSGAPRFLNYTSAQTAIQLYKKDEASATTCSWVTDVVAEISKENLVKLSWTAPENVPANGYKISITQGQNAVVTDHVVASGSTEYACDQVLSENTEYTYSIVSVCSETEESAAATGKFKTPLRIDGIVVFEEDFARFTTGSTTELSNNLDAYTAVKGWKGSKVYASEYQRSIKLGSGSGIGHIQLPELDLMENFTIYFTAEGWAADENQLKVSVNGVQCGELISIPVGQEGAIKVDYAAPTTKAGTSGSMKATIKIETTSKRCRSLDNIRIYQADSTPKPQPVCNAVANVQPKPGYGRVVLSWEAPEPAPSSGYAVEIFTKADNTSVFKDTTDAKTLLCESLQEDVAYTYAITSLCAAGLNSETVTGDFTTLKKGVPHITIENPGEGREYITSTVTFSYHTESFPIGTAESDSGFAKYTITGDKLEQPVTDTCARLSFTREFDFSGEYKVEFTLVDKDLNPVTEANTIARNFSVNLPDAEAPVFAPETASLDAVTDVTLTCPTQDATIYYALNGSEFKEYTQPVKLETNGTYAFKAFALKARMDTSAITSKTYTLRLPIEIEGEIVFEEPFDKIEKTSTSTIDKDMDKYTLMPGWKAVNVYPQTGGMVKMGTSSKIGSIETPALDLSANGGKFIVAFEAQAWKGDMDNFNLVIGSQTINVTGLVNDKDASSTVSDLKEFAFEFTNGTTETKIKFEAALAIKNRFFLDNIRIYQVLPAVPTINVPASLAMSTTMGTPVSQKVTVKGKLLENDVTVTCPAGNFSVSPATLAKADVMSENGAEITVTFNGTVVSDSVVVTLASGTLSKQIKVKASAATITEVNDLTELLQGTEGQLYRIKGEVILTASDTYRNYKWVQDGQAGILIDDADGLATRNYAIGDGISGIVGKLGSFSGQPQLVMTGNLPEASSHGNTITPVEVSVAELTGNAAKYCSRVIKLTGLTLNAADGQWESNKDHQAKDENGNEINIRTFVRNGNFIGTGKPQGSFDLVALAGLYNGNVQVSPRTVDDILADETPEGTVATPSFSPNPGIIELGGTITIGCATKDAVIYFTTDGSTPTTSSTRYTGGITMGLKELVIKAFAVKEGMKDSKVAEARYTTPVGNEANASLKTRIFPNPNDGTFAIELAEDARLDIFNLSGAAVRSLDLSAGKTEISLPRSGIYFVRLANSRGTVVKRVIVR